MNDTNRSAPKQLHVDMIRVVALSAVAEALGAPHDRLIESAEESDFSLDANMKCLATSRQFIDEILNMSMDVESDFDPEALAMLERARALLADDIYVDLMA